MRYCQSPGCSRPVSGWSLHCNAHKSRARRHGDAQQEGITKAHLKPYLEVVRRRIAKNADNPAWKTMEGNWLALVEHAHAELTTYNRGAVHIRQHREAYEEVKKLAKHVKPAAVVETVLALYLMAEQDSRRFRSDDGFRFQLVRRVRGLTDVNRGTWYDNKIGRVKGVYRDLAPKATEYLCDLLATTLGAAGLYVARLEQAQAEQQKASRTRLFDALSELK
jgi:hypothetical protein